jgi:hypothetical protein
MITFSGLEQILSAQRAHHLSGNEPGNAVHAPPVKIAAHLSIENFRILEQNGARKTPPPAKIPSSENPRDIFHSAPWRLGAAMTIEILC